MKIPMTNIRKTLFQLTPHPVHWRRDTLQPSQIKRGGLDRNGCVHVPDGGRRCVTWNARELIGSLTSSHISREQKYDYFRRRIDDDNIICFQEVHGKDEFLQAIQVLAPRFWLYGTFITRQRKCRSLGHMHSLKTHCLTMLW